MGWQLKDSNTNHVKSIKELVAKIEHYGGNVRGDMGLIEHEKEKDGGNSSDETYKKIFRAKTLGCAIVKYANNNKYQLLMKDIRAHYSHRQDL